MFPRNGSTPVSPIQTFVRRGLDDERLFVVGCRQTERPFERREHPLAAIAYPTTHDLRNQLCALDPYLVPDERRRPSGRSQTPVSVFWRRRLAALVAAAVVVWLAVAAFSGVTTALRGLGSRPLATPELAGAGQPISSTVHVVQPGETLWTIARRLQPGGDIRPLVDRLAALHGRGPLLVGERLLLR
jgi:hypothetical protein